jgi:hypothetical protein
MNEYIGIIIPLAALSIGIVLMFWMEDKDDNE